MVPTNDANALAYPPTPCDKWRQAGWLQSRLRRRLLEGTWGADLTDALASEVEADRLDMWGVQDQTKNVARDVWTQSAALYREEPSTSNAGADPATLEAFRALLDGAGWRATMDAAQPMILAQREGVIRVDVVKVGDDRTLRFTSVAADLVEAWPFPQDPERVQRLAIYTLRPCCDLAGNGIPGLHPDAFVWTREVWDLGATMDAKSATYRVEQVSETDGQPVKVPRDLTKYYSPVVEGYPWVNAAGRPYIPAVLYHARRGLGRLFDPFYGIELVLGSLAVAVFFTMWRHSFRDASYPQRAVMDADPAGGVRPSERTPNAASVTTDATSIMLWRSRGDKQGSFYQFEPGADPIALGNAIENYSAGLVAAFGVSAADVQRVAADPRSGYAIALSREGIRKEIAKAASAFRVADAELLGVVATMWNAWGDAASPTFPETGWSVDYRGLPLSGDEEKIEMERAKLRLELGIASKVDLYMTAHGVTRPEALAALKVIAEETALLATFGAPEPADTSEDVADPADVPEPDPAEGEPADKTPKKADTATGEA